MRWLDEDTWAAPSGDWVPPRGPPEVEANGNIWLNRQVTRKAGTATCSPMSVSGELLSSSSFEGGSRRSYHSSAAGARWAVLPNAASPDRLPEGDTNSGDRKDTSIAHSEKSAQGAAAFPSSSGTAARGAPCATGIHARPERPRNSLFNALLTEGTPLDEVHPDEIGRRRSDEDMGDKGRIVSGLSEACAMHGCMHPPHLSVAEEGAAAISPGAVPETGAGATTEEESVRAPKSLFWGLMTA